MSEHPAWPPPFTVRVSNKARYARLRVSPGKGLEVVLPYKQRTLSAMDIVEYHKKWVEKTLRRLGAEHPAPEQISPEAVFLHGGKRNIPLVYEQPRTALVNGFLHMASGKDEAEKSARILQRFAREYAYEFLGEKTARIAAEHGLAPSGLRFRRQKSRWGSCSGKGALSLNTCLVFIPEELAGFVIMHELAHTKHMNHGREFWKLLFGMEEKALALDTRLRSAWKYVPQWIWL